MCNPVQIIVDVIVENIVKTVFKSVGRHVGFLFHYKQNVKNLEDEKNNLQQQRNNVQEKVNEANHRGEAIYNKVSDWLKDVDKTREGVDKFMGEKIVKENIQCFNFSCPDFTWRYRLSKQAEKAAVHIKHLAESGSQIGPISHPRENPPELELPSSKAYEDFHSRQKVLKDIEDALKDSKVNTIGVYGTGGIGKTTMVEKVGKLLKGGTFDEVVMAVVSKDANVKNIQGQLADRLDVTFSGETEVGRANQLWKRLDNKKKNLIILDDVWQELDLEKIGIPITDEKKSCKVVLTSRNRDVWKNMDVHKDFTIEILSQEEAWTLFKKKVGDYVDSPGQPLLGEIAWAVCKECQGLPVAINALGVALKGKDMNAWQDALDKLQNSMLKEIEGINPKVYTSLKWSYDWLDSEDAKSCFLLCCLFPEDAEIQIDDLVRYYMAGRILRHYQMPNTLEKALYRVCSVVGTLKSCGLLLDGNGEFLVKMHDVVRDVAISIAKDEKSFIVKHGFEDWPEKAACEHYSVISLRPNGVRKFPDELVCPDLHILRLDCTINQTSPQIPDNFFSRTEKLMVLDLSSATMFPLLPASFAKLAKLHMLCLNQCKLGDIAILKDLKDHLEILSLRGSDIVVLPLEVGELTGLRLLDMENCYSLEMIPKGVISKLTHLEELYMPLSFDQWEGTGAERKISNVSVDELMSLTRLTTLHIWIPDTTLLPKGLTFENLVRFRIKFGQDKYYYGDQGLRIKDSYSEASTGVLKLENFQSANTLEFLLGKPKWSIQRNGLYPSKFINHLTDLSVIDCGIKYLFSPSCARGLVRLQYLAIQNCRVMEGVIGTEGDKDEDILIIFSGLKTLYLDNLPNLISFYPKMEKTATSGGSSSSHAQTVLFNDKATFPALESLEIQSVEKITEIWDKQMLPIQEIPTESPFCELSKLEINACNNLMNVVGGWPKLEAIGTEKQKGKEVDDYHVTRFPKLKIMRLKGLQNLESFCSRSTRCEVLPLFDHQVEFPVLEELRISRLQNITDIWDMKFHQVESFCPLLRELCVSDCDELVNVVRCNMLPQLRNLEIHSLPSCTSMEVIVDLEKREEEAQEAANNTIIPFPELTEMLLGCLPNIKSFCIFRSGEQPVFNAQVAFPKLENLYLPSLGERVLQQLLGAFELPSLKHLRLYNCDEVSTMSSPHFLRSLRNGVLLTVEECKGVREVFHFDGLEVGDGQECVGRPSLIQVRMVQLDDLPQLTCLWNKDPRVLLDLQNLEYLTIKNCPLLANLMTASVAKALGGLKVLCLRSCSIMEEVITTDEEGHKDVIDVADEIVFPKLERLILEDLPNLKSFSGSNHNLNFPSLRRVVLRRCPKVQTFTSGSVRMPQILLTASGNDGLVIEDLNKCLEQQRLKGDEGIIRGISEMPGGYDMRYYHLKYLLPYSRLDDRFEELQLLGR